MSRNRNYHIATFKTRYFIGLSFIVVIISIIYMDYCRIGIVSFEHNAVSYFLANIIYLHIIKFTTFSLKFYKMHFVFNSNKSFNPLNLLYKCC